MGVYITGFFCFSLVTLFSIYTTYQLLHVCVTLFKYPATKKRKKKKTFLLLLLLVAYITESVRRRSVAPGSSSSSVQIAYVFAIYDAGRENRRESISSATSVYTKYIGGIWRPTTDFCASKNFLNLPPF